MIGTGQAAIFLATAKNGGLPGEPDTDCAGVGKLAADAPLEPWSRHGYLKDATRPRPPTVSPLTGRNTYVCVVTGTNR